GRAARPAHQRGGVTERSSPSCADPLRSVLPPTHRGSTMAPERRPLPGPPARPNRSAVSRWPLWRLPRLLLAAGLAVEAVAAGPLPTAGDLWVGVVLCALGIAHNEMAAGVERERRRLSGASHVDLSSVWTFAAALVLPGTHAAVVAAVVLLHLWSRAWRHW